MFINPSRSRYPRFEFELTPLDWGCRGYFGRYGPWFHFGPLYMGIHILDPIEGASS